MENICEYKNLKPAKFIYGSVSEPNMHFKKTKDNVDSGKAYVAKM
jgi:hypothetical protein